MKRLLTVLMAGLLIAAFVVPAAAWEFSMTGEYEMRLRYISRTGDMDLFGKAPLQDGGAIAIDPLNTLTAPNSNNVQGQAVGFAGPSWYNTNRNSNQQNLAGASTGAQSTETLNAAGDNITRPISTITGQFADNPGARIVRGGYSTWGCDALNHDSRLTLRPVIRVNPAIRVHGVYTVGGMRHKYFQNYIGAFGQGIGTPPLERYYQHQTSMNAYDTAALGSWEQFRATIQTPLFIMSIGVKDFPFGTGLNASYETRAESFLMVAPYGPFRFLLPVWLARSSNTGDSWTTVPDKDTKPELYTGGAVTYNCGAFEAGALNISRWGHLNPGIRNGGLARDRVFTLFGVYSKYNNGRVFAAAEYGWVNYDWHHIGAAPVYIESYQAWAEVGAVAGPTKVRLAYFQASGNVLNDGNATKAFSQGAVNYQVARPYQRLMFETYAGGTNTFHETHGYMADAYAFAGRADYAVASNLNMWATYMWAHRLEQNGVFAGSTLATGAAGGGTVAAAQAWKALNSGSPAAGLNPYVDDGFIGWEAQAGMDWKILEGLTWFTRYSYWQPGEWFEQAYRGVGMVGGVPSEQALIKGRDAIHAIEGSFYINF